MDEPATVVVDARDQELFMLLKKLAGFLGCSRGLVTGFPYIDMFNWMYPLATH